MNRPTEPSPVLAALEALLDPESAGGAVDPAIAAALAAEPDAPAGNAPLAPGVAPATLAAHLDGALDAAAREALIAHLAASAPARRDAEAAIALLEAIAAPGAAAPAPPDLLAAAIAAANDTANDTAAPAADILPLRRRPAPPPAERFLLLAAASGQEGQPVLCRSQSGLWTLEIFLAAEPSARAEGRGELLLTVDPDHRATYEGRRARVFVTLAGEERVLAEAVVREGEVFAPVALAGLDLFTRDAVSVTFGPAPAVP